MQVKVKYFGQIAELTNRNDEVLNIQNSDYKNEMTMGDLIEKILSEYNSLDKVSFRMSLNMKIVGTDAIISENDEIAILPPFAGG